MFKEGIKIMTAGALAVGLTACERQAVPTSAPTSDVTPTATAIRCNGLTVEQAIDALEGNLTFSGHFEADRDSVEAHCISDEWHLTVQGDGTFDRFPRGFGTQEPMKYDTAGGIVANNGGRAFVRESSTGPQYTPTPAGE